MSVHLAQMNQLENDDPITWKAMKEGNVGVKKSNSPFTALFTEDQRVERGLSSCGHYTR